MSIRIQAYVWIAATCLVVPARAGAQQRTEREVVELIVRDGPRAEAIRAAVEVKRQQHLVRLAVPNPTVQYVREGAGVTHFFLAEQALQPFGLRSALTRVDTEVTASAEAERDAGLWLLRADASRAAARLVSEQERLRISHEYIREVERLIGVLRTREQEGEGSKFDRLRAEQELREARQIRTSAAIAMADARAAVLALAPPGTTFNVIAADPDRPGVSLQAAALVDRALKARAEFRALTSLIRQTELETDAARQSRSPAITFSGGIKRADEANVRRTGGVFGISLSLPLFDAGSREAAPWSAEHVRVTAERAALEQRIRAEIDGALEALTLRQAALTEDRSDEGAELMRIAEIAYREGEAGILELLDAARTMVRARMRSVDIRLGVREAQIALERAVGDSLWP